MADFGVLFANIDQGYSTGITGIIHEDDYSRASELVLRK